MSYLGKWMSKNRTPQSAPIPGNRLSGNPGRVPGPSRDGLRQAEPAYAHASQVANSAGGYAFAVDDWARLDRFLILGSEGGSYYATEQTLTRDNARAVLHCVQADGLRTVRRLVEISDAGRAPKNDPALFALAMAAKLGDVETRRAAFASLPRVARIGTHLFHFAEYVKALGGWGRGTMRAFARWYTEMEASRLALQAVKYQSRDGWSHRDLLRKAHPVAKNEQQQAIFHWMTKGWEAVGVERHPDEVLAMIWAFERAKSLRERKDVGLLCSLVREHRLPHQCVPTEAKQFPEVWEALLPEMGFGALLRNLGKMTEVGWLSPFSDAERLVASRLERTEALRAARVHPLQILVALRTYAQGHGERGKLTWDPVRKIVDALDGAFYRAFKVVEPTGARTLLALDVSSSMGGGLVAGLPGITPRVGSAAMALITAAVEPAHEFVAFTNGISPIAISPRMRLDDAIAAVSGLPFGGTDCALPMLWAAKRKVPVDLFCIYTDSETWAGDIHPVQALRAYRQKMGVGAKLVVIGMVSNGFSIADPDDGGMLDVVGFDTASPSVISDFATRTWSVG